jgi:hypothetical protein
MRGQRRGQNRSWRGRRPTRWQGKAHRPLVEAGTGDALTADEELSVGYFGLVAAKSSRETPSLRRAFCARGQRPGVS